eukprot:10040840-Heterocapsa_arctica.AAC.1
MAPLPVGSLRVECVPSAFASELGAAPRGRADVAGGGWMDDLRTGDVGRPRAGGAARRPRANAGLCSGARLGQDLMIFEAL